jgi:hypothetical protein
VPRGPVVGAELAVQNAAGQIERVAARPYRVAQQGGSAFGYRIEPFEAGDSPLQPDFVAMRLGPEAGPPTRLSLLDRAGAELPNSQRPIRPLQTPPDPLLYTPVLLPLLLAAAVRLRRHPARRAESTPPAPGVAA